jgi:argininosuccinate lyase
VGQAQAIVTTVHNTPFGDIVDTEDDLQPLVATMFRDATRMVALVAAAMRLADFDVARLAARAGEGGTTLTELADTLVRDHGLSFRSAHSIAAALLKARTEDPSAALSAALAKVSTAILGRALEYPEDDLQRIMSPAHFVDVRTTHGGPAPSQTGRAITESLHLLQRDREAWQARRARLQQSEAQLAARSTAL